jgi:hypothetical protein
MRLGIEPLPPEVRALSTMKVLQLAAGCLVVLVVLIAVFFFSIEVPTLALVATSIGIVMAFKAWPRPRFGRWASIAMVLFSLLSGFLYVRHIDGTLARERLAFADAKSARDAHKTAQDQREARKQSALEAASQENKRKRDSVEEAKRLELERQLATLRQTDLDKYLERLKASNPAFWLEEVKLLRPALYEAHIKQQNQMRTVR